MTWQKAKLKYVTRLIYGDPPPRINETQEDSIQEGSIKVFGSNGTFATCNQANTKAPAIIVGRKGSYGKINWSQESCFASDTTFFIDESTTKQHLRWLFYLLQTLNLDQGTDEAAVPGLNRDDAYDREVLVPSLSEQQAIANYLDHETVKIDKLISAKERLLDLLTEKRQSLITNVITCGLNPDVPMRDSGIEWIGNIPQHWEVEHLKYHIAKIEQGWSPQCDNFPADEDEWGVLKVGAVNAWEFNPDENKRLPTDLKPLTEYEIKPGDILISRANTTELVGSAALVDQVRSKLILCDKLYRLKMYGNRLYPEYLVFYLRSIAGRFEFERDATGASNSMQNISQEIVTNLWIPIPPIDEQNQIVDHIKANVLKLDNLTVAAKRTIELLQERRTALITAAVTGQISIKK